MKAWGQHLILNIAGCNENVSQKISIKKFVKELVSSIEMIPYKEPIIEHFAEHSEEAAGYSLVQLIQTSAICGHFSDKNRDAYLDIFSCKSFDNDKVIEVIRKYFDPKTVQILCLEREAKLSSEYPFKEIILK